MRKKPFLIFIITLILTLICGIIVTYPAWSVKLIQNKDIAPSENNSQAYNALPDTSTETKIVPVVESIPTFSRHFMCVR